MPDSGSDRPHLTVGSLIGVPLGSPGSAATTPPSPVTPTAPAEVPPTVGPQPPGSPIPPETMSALEEKPWTLVDGTLGPPYAGAGFTGDGVEALTYNNALRQAIEQVWFDGKLVYALDVGEIDVNPEQVKVAQEYQIVYAVDLDERGKKRSEPATVPGQLNIYDSIPGMSDYSPIWQFNYVVVPASYQPNTLRSARDCLASGYPIQRSQDFEN